MTKILKTENENPPLLLKDITIKPYFHYGCALRCNVTPRNAQR